MTEITTVQEGTLIDGGTFKVPEPLANKIIHPFGDFLLHDISTGDGIVQNGGKSMRLKVRTAPLRGARTHTRLMHDVECLRPFNSSARNSLCECGRASSGAS
ncbi:MAG: hypothetical protein QOJ70_420 [Acidobacteriota bacterium]|nr:hypothetical protein [Acidobacteriota bacterium]